MRALLLFFIATSAVAGPKRTPPPEVMARFEAHVQAEIEKNQPPVKVTYVKPKEAEKAWEEPPPDKSCQNVEKYARAVSLLHEAGISLDELPRQNREYTFDIDSIKTSIYSKSKSDWGQKVEFVRWNCDHIGVNNLKLALEF